MKRGASVGVCLAGVALACAAVSCRPDPEEDTSGRNEETARPAAVLDFADELHVADESVNAFITGAMTTCAAGDYDAFRLLWTAKQDPLSRREFEKGWQAVREIRIRALEAVRLAPDPSVGRIAEETVYAVYAEVLFDPSLRLGSGEAQRRAVSMVIREHDAWRLARAPKALRVWLSDRVKEGGSDPQRTDARAAVTGRSG